MASSLFDFSFLHNENRNSADTTLLTPTQDEFERFLFDSAIPDSSATSTPLSGSVSPSTGLGSFDNQLFSANNSSMFQFLFNFPEMTDPVQPLDLQKTMSISTASTAPDSPGSSVSGDTTARGKSGRGRKPKVLSEDEKVSQAMQRKEKNKEFAQISRDRKRKYVEDLESSNTTLTERVKQLETQNASLMEKLLELTRNSTQSLLRPQTNSLTSFNPSKSLMRASDSSSKTATRFFTGVWPFTASDRKQPPQSLFWLFSRRVFGM